MPNEPRAKWRCCACRCTSFNDGSDSASSWDYHGLPKPSGYTFQNRFVGDYLLYGTGSGWGAPQNKTAIKPLRGALGGWRPERIES